LLKDSNYLFTADLKFGLWFSFIKKKFKIVEMKNISWWTSAL